MQNSSSQENPSVKRQLVSGSLFLAVAKYSGMAVNLGVIAVLARLLSPELFALAAITSVFSNFFLMFCDFGVAAAIIQHRSLTPRQISHVFSFCGWGGILLALLFFFCGSPVASFYGEPALCGLVQLVALQVLFASLNIVPNALLLRAKKFRFMAFRTAGVNLVAGASAVAAAFLGAGVYALIVTPLVSSALLFVVNYVKVSPLPFFFRPAYSEVKMLVGYSSYNLWYNVLNYFSRNLDKLAVGKFMPMSELGFYEKAYTLMLMPVQQVTAVVNPVIHPVLSAYQNDRAFLFRQFRSAVRLFAQIGFPLSVLLSFFSPEIIGIVLGSNWDAAVPVFRIFALSVGFQLVYALQGPFFLVTGKPKWMFLCGFVPVVLNLSALAAGLAVWHSTVAVAILIDVAYVLSLWTTFHVLVTRCFGERPQQIWTAILPPLLKSALWLVAAELVCHYWMEATPLIAAKIGLSLPLLHDIWKEWKRRKAGFVQTTKKA